MILCSVKQSDCFQQLEFHKATKVNLINVSKINKALILAVRIYYLEMTKFLLNFVHLEKLLSGLVEQDKFPDIFSWINFHDEYDSFYASNNIDFSYRFNYTKSDYIHLASSLPYMTIEHLFSCPCDPLINNQYWDVFDCSIPFKQDRVMCSKPRKCKNNILNFQNMNGLLKHLKEHKCYHHTIVCKYFTFYLRLKDKQSFLSNQLKDVTKHNKKC